MHFNKNKIALAISTLLLSANSAAFQLSEDQTDQSDSTEVITVTASKDSLIKAQALKREKDFVADGITAEELGVFPDANVADSLSHITGVSIAAGRTSGGEGQGVSIRGMGPEFSIVTLNGRILATDQNGREFAFDVLPSEVISEAWVFKSVTASQLEGSIGGAIDLKTARPMDTPEGVKSVSIEGQYGDKSEEYGFKATGIFSQLFMDNKLGVAVSALYSDTPTRTDSLSDMNYSQQYGGGFDHNGDGNVAWNSSSAELIIPAVVAYRTRIEDKKRSSLSTVVQYQPNKDTDIVFDALWTRLDSPSNGYTASMYLNGTDKSLWRDPEFAGYISEGFPEGHILTGITVDNLVPEILNETEHRVVDTYQLGANGTFTLNNNFVMELDAYWSKATRNAGGKDQFIVAKATGGVPNTARFSLNDGGLPSVDFTFDESSGINSFADLNTNADWGPHFSEKRGVDIDDEVYGLSAEGTYYLDKYALDSIDFGLIYSKRTKDRVKLDNASTRTLYSNAPFSFADTGVDVVFDNQLNDFLTDVPGNFPRMFPAFNLDAYNEALAAADNNPNIINPATGEPYPAGYSIDDASEFNPNESFEVVEETQSAYVQANLSGTLGDFPWRGNVGLRYVSNDAASNGFSWDIAQVNQPNVGVWVWEIVREGDAPVAISEKNNYSKLLPSMNLAFELSDELLLRFSYAQVMSRASLNQLSTQVDDSGATFGYWGINRVGNPQLKPVEAEQADLSLEWYYSEGNSITAAVFKKDIKNLIQDGQNVYLEDEENRPVYPVQNGISPWIDGGYDEIPFNVFEPRNLDKANVLGYELAVQHFFENGFGVTANYTYIDTESIVGDFNQGRLEGVPDTTYNLQLYYNNDKFNVSIGASHTESFLLSHYSSVNLNTRADYRYKTYADPMTWASASITYLATEQLQVYAQFNNILNDGWQSYNGGFSNITPPGGYSEWGRKVNVGIRYKF